MGNAQLRYNDSLEDFQKADDPSDPSSTYSLLPLDGLIARVFAGIINSIYPVGSVYTSVVSTNPGTLFGFGTWVTLAPGRVLVGIDPSDTDFDVVRETRGAKTHTLVEAEIPAHTHIQNSHNHTQDAHGHNILLNANQAPSGSVEDIPQAGGASTAGIVESTTATNQAATATNQNTGGGGSHNNIQPSYVVYRWERTA